MGCRDPEGYGYSREYTPGFHADHREKTVSSQLCFRRGNGEGQGKAPPYCQSCFDDHVLNDAGLNPNLAGGSAESSMPGMLMFYEHSCCACGACHPAYGWGKNRPNNAYTAAERAAEASNWSTQSTAAPSAFDFLYDFLINWKGDKDKLYAATLT